jgi:hypothetical protein
MSLIPDVLFYPVTVRGRFKMMIGAKDRRAALREARKIWKTAQLGKIVKNMDQVHRMWDYSSF